LNPEEKRRAKTEAGNIIVEGINQILDRHDSPVERGQFKRNKKDGQPSSLFEFGDMRAQITFEELDSDHIDVGIFSDAPEVERFKAFNHNTGDTLPKREFIASPNKRFKKEIMDRVDEAIDAIREDAEQRQEIENNLVETVLTGEDLLDILNG